jgi:hypothetical protein
MNVIHDEVQALLVAKRVHHEVAEIVRNNTALGGPNPFYGYLGSTYTSHVVVGLRRQLKIGRDNISMASLFAEMIKAPYVITREDFVSK